MFHKQANGLFDTEGWKLERRRVLSSLPGLDDFFGVQPTVETVGYFLSSLPGLGIFDDRGSMIGWIKELSSGQSLLTSAATLVMMDERR